MKKLKNYKFYFIGVSMAEKSIEKKKQELISLIEAFFDRNFNEKTNAKEKKNVTKNKKAN